MDAVTVEGLSSARFRVNKLELIEGLADDLAHEIRNPLHSMAIHLEVLKRRAAGTSSADIGSVGRCIDVLSEELERLNGRTDLFFRLASAASAVDRTTLNGAVEELIKLVRKRGERRGVTVRVEPGPEDVPLPIPPPAFRQLALNLVLGALDDLHVGDTMRLHASLRNGDACLVVSCASARPDQLGTERAPESFARLDVARELAEAYGGSVAGPGGPGAHGSDFALRLPVSVSEGDPGILADG